MTKRVSGSRVFYPSDPYWHPPLHSYSGEVNNGVILSNPPACNKDFNIATKFFTKKEKKK